MWVPICIYGGKNVEYGEDVGNHKVQIPKGKVSPGTKPKSSTFSIPSI